MRRALIGVLSGTLAFSLGFACVGADPDASSETTDAAPSTGVDASVDKVDSGSDAALDAPVMGDAGCGPEVPFRTLSSVGNDVNTSISEENARLTADELVMFVTVYGPTTNRRIHRFERASVGSAWVDKGLLFGQAVDRGHAWPSAKAERLYYSQHDNGSDYWHIVFVNLDDAGAPAGSASYLANVAATSNELTPYLTADESELWFTSNRVTGANTYDIFRAARVDGGFGPPSLVSELNTTAMELGIVLAADSRTIYFGSARNRATGTSVWMATRATPTGPFTDLRLVPGLETLHDENAPNHASATPTWVSPDGCRLYVSTTKDNGTDDLYIASKR